MTHPRIALIGCGLVGQKRLNLLPPGCVTVTCDLDLDRAKKLAAQSPGCVATDSVAQAVTARVPVPIIGIGASAACDGQVLVAEDILGLFSSFKPRFVKRYAELGADIEEAAARYAADVRTRSFPGPEHIFGAMKKHG